MDPGFLDPGFLDPGILDPGFLDPGILDPGIRSKSSFGPRSGMFFWRFWSEDWDLGPKLRASILAFRCASIGVQDTWYNPHGWREVLLRFGLGPGRKICVWNKSESCETAFLSSNQAENKTLRSGPVLWLRKWRSWGRKTLTFGV